MKAVHRSAAIAELQRTKRALAGARSLADLQRARERAEALRCRFRKSRLGVALQNEAAAVKLRAERSLGKLLAALHPRGGDHRSKSRDESLKLLERAIDHNASARWRLAATVPETDFQRYLRQCTAKEIQVSSAGLLRLAKQLRGDADCADQHSRVVGRANGPCRHSDGDGVAMRTTIAQQIAAKSSDLASLAAATLSDVEELQNHDGQLARLLAPVLKQGPAHLDESRRSKSGGSSRTAPDSTRRCTARSAACAAEGQRFGSGAVVYLVGTRVVRHESLKKVS